MPDAPSIMGIGFFRVEMFTKRVLPPYHVTPPFPPFGYERFASPSPDLPSGFYIPYLLWAVKLTSPISVDAEAMACNSRPSWRDFLPVLSRYMKCLNDRGPCSRTRASILRFPRAPWGIMLRPLCAPTRRRGSGFPAQQPITRAEPASSRGCRRYRSDLRRRRSDLPGRPRR